MEEDPDKALAHDSRLDEISQRYEELVKDRQNLIKALDKIYYNPDTGEKVVEKGVTKYDVLEIKYDVLEMKYNAEREEKTRLLRRVAAQKSENEVLHRKVKDLCHKLCQARRERDKLAEKLRIAEGDDQKRSLLIETLNQFFNEETKC